ncbi:uncharacterized protein LOC100208182 isoform X2 [Hydra vulgaris]|uniref:Uncharacterized protein LOC100208182 isoform X2 n=1 Tax=Hydra vulgaris TaxID=6087 RepID=A0ABM4BJ85_HYDVU
MNEHNWIRSMRNKVNKLCNNVTFNAIYQKSNERLPPRLNYRGLSYIARVLGHGIRDITKEKTGKDLACLRDNVTRNKMLRLLSGLFLTIANYEARKDFLYLVENHSSSFTSALSMDGDEGSYSKQEFKKHANLHNFIANYHKICMQQEQNLEDFRNTKNKQKVKTSDSSNRQTLIHQNEKFKSCRCNMINSLKDQSKCFTGCWLHTGISEAELDTYYNDNISQFQLSPSGSKLVNTVPDDWSEFTSSEHCIVFRKRLPNGLYKYKVQATFYNITANHLFNVQINTEYRKSWDPYVVKLDLVDSNNETNSQLVHWVTKCPYPFSTREYIYLRRYKIDDKRKVMILCQSATDKSSIPYSNGVERVDIYDSKMIIKPHKSDFNENGCDFLLTYYDDPKIKFVPERVMDMAASRGICESTSQMYNAALRLAHVS